MPLHLNRHFLGLRFPEFPVRSRVPDHAAVDDEGADVQDTDVVGVVEVGFQVEFVEVEGNEEGGEVWGFERSAEEGYYEVGSVGRSWRN